MFQIIKRHPNYVVDQFGNVYRKYYKSKVVLFPLKPDTSNGYFRYDLDGKKESAGRLVLEAFDPVDDPSLKVFYIDGNKLNPNLDNLVWLTPSDIQRYSAYTVEYRRQMLRGRG